MNNLLKPNVLCFCGSGKKYRSCCSLLPRPSYLTEDQLNKYLRLFGKANKFLASGNVFLSEAIGAKKCLSVGCNDDACASHLIPKGKLSQNFTNGHGYMYQVSDSVVRENRSIGIGKATIFWGWCSRHDSALFRMTDQLNFGMNNSRLDELCCKLSGRGYRLKHNQLRNIYSLMQAGVCDISFSERRHGYYDSYIKRRKIYLELYIKKIKNRKILDHYIFKITKTNTIFLSNMLYFNMDINGKYLNPTSSSYVFCNIFPEGEDSFITFSVPQGVSNDIRHLLDAIRKIYDEDLELFKRIINNIILYYNFFSVITEDKVIEKVQIVYTDFEEQFPDNNKYKLKDLNRVVFLM